MPHGLDVGIPCGSSGSGRRLTLVKTSEQPSVVGTDHTLFDSRSPPTNSGTQRTSHNAAPQHQGISHVSVPGIDSSLKSELSNSAHPAIFGSTDSLLPASSDLPPDSDAILQDILSDPSFNPDWFNIDPSDYYGANNNSCGFIPNIPNIIDEVDRSDIMQTTEMMEGTPMSGLASLSDKCVVTLFIPVRIIADKLKTIDTRQSSTCRC